MKQFILILLTFAGLTCMAQNRPESYNFKRGVEAVQNEKNEEALEYFNKDIDENPKSGYSYSWIAWLRLNSEEYGRALTAADLAIRHLPKKDTEYMRFTYNTRASVYCHLADTIKAINDYTAAIKADPQETSAYKYRAQIYYEQGKYDLADADYDKIIELDPGSVFGYMGKGRNANAQKRWDDAIKLFDYVEKLASDYTYVYTFRATAYIGKEKWDEATDDLVTVLTLKWDRQAMDMITQLKEPAFTMMVSKLKVQSAKMPNDSKWPYLTGAMYEANGNYAKAIGYYTEANGRETSPTMYYRIAMCQLGMGEYDAGLRYIDQALSMDSTSYAYLSYLSCKADLYSEKGDLQQAIAVWDKALAQKPDDGPSYAQRGSLKDYAGDIDGAVEDLTMAVTLDPTDSYSYSFRGSIYQRRGQKDLAESDFRKVIEIEDTHEKYQCIYYAYHWLGQDNKAIAAMDSIIARDATSAGTYYDAACLYSLMENKAKALEYLETSLQKGYVGFTHMGYDHDMDFLRATEEYKALVAKYKNAKEKNSANRTSSDVADEQQDDLVTTEIPFVKEDGVCKVKCKINGLPLHFVFDTGASDVTISIVEATFMMKNGYLNSKDVVGSQRYMDANGDINVGTVIKLKDVAFGDLQLNNVRASVVRSQEAPLLLGQSVLGRLGKIEIDNAAHVIKITHKGK